MTDVMEQAREHRTLSSDKKVQPAKLAHVVLRTQQVAEMRDWYCEVLGGHVTAEDLTSSPKLCFMTFDEEHHRVAMIEHPAAPAPGKAGNGSLEHIAFTYDNLGDLLSTYERLASKGIRPFWPINHGGTLSFYYNDPDMNRVELSLDTIPIEEAMEFMKTDHFRQNPIGVIIDPDDLVQRYKSGESIASLTKPLALPEGKTPIDMLR